LRRFHVLFNDLLLAFMRGRHPWAGNAKLHSWFFAGSTGALRARDIAGALGRFGASFPALRASTVVTMRVP
jgi:hypothetical protein